MWPADFNEAVMWSRATPWKAFNELRRLVMWPWIGLYFASHGIAVGRDWRIYGAPMIQRHRGSLIAFGDGLELRSWRWSNPLVADHRCMFSTWSEAASIEIGAGFGMTGGTICAAGSVRIGSYVVVGANCTIMDTDFHQLPLAKSRTGADAKPSAVPVVIHDHAFIGTRTLILKGVTIGEAAIVGAGSVVTHSIPAHAVAAGNPATVVGEVHP
jgi:acetyltransferase-like isoleucine patch superfamily enzyme